MSFILDALKKSESDRQRQSGPSLFEVKVAPPRRRLPIWAAAIAVLLGINAIVVSWMLLRRAPAQPAAASSAVAAPPPSHTIARTVGRMAPGETAPARGAANAVSAADGTAAREPVPAAAPAPVSPGHPGAAPPLRG
ncbi:MAG TPA: hypothetical protein VND24_06650, partial [Steroidobacteraceae bacterium]|nr:hypothetical protein [Steroidobacteraceae bacterium]